MSDQDTRDNVLTRILGRNDAAQKLREAAETATEELDEQGVEHKTLTLPELSNQIAGLGDELQRALRLARQAQVETTNKSKTTLTVDDLAELIMLAEVKLREYTDDHEKREKLNEFLSELLEDDGFDLDMGIFASDGEDETEKTLATDDGEGESEDSQKARAYLVELLEQLVEDQGDIADALTAQKTAMDALVKADIPDALTSLADRLKAVERQLSQRPRPASESDETTLDLDELTEAFKKTNQRETVKAGIKVYDYPDDND